MRLPFGILIKLRPNQTVKTFFETKFSEGIKFIVSFWRSFSSCKSLLYLNPFDIKDPPCRSEDILSFILFYLYIFKIFKKFSLLVD